jgi:hypothetical protein
MKRLAMCLCALTLLGVNVAAANMFVDPSFENQITYDGPPFIGSWEGFSAGAGSEAINGTVMPRTGTLHLSLSIFGVENAFAGAFQDVVVSPGTTYTFSGWHKTISNPLDLGVEARIEWRNSGTNAEVGRTPNLTTPPTSDYTQFMLSGLAPANADLARVVYAIQTFGPEPTNSGTVFVDDVFFGVPEPGSIALAGIAGVGLLASRRRRRA